MSQKNHDLLDRIRSRGYWQVVIRPTRFAEKLIPNIEELFPLVQQASVQLRGWDFPHIDTHQRHHIDVDWVGQEFEWEHYLEVWRFYQSGQFVHISGMFDDWRDQSNFWNRPLPEGWAPGIGMPFTSTVWRYTEIFEFASRLVTTKAFSSVDRLAVEIHVKGLSGRQLYVDDHAKTPFFNKYQATLQEYPSREEYPRDQLIAEPRKLALTPAAELLQRFHYNASPVMLEEVQASLYRTFR